VDAKNAAAIERIKTKLADLEQIRRPFHWTDATNPIQWQSTEAEDGVWIDVNEGESPRA
jgi:hypothetical protein